MAEQVRGKPTWSSWSRFERLALLSTILIWAGVISFGIGLFVTLRNVHANRIAYAQLASVTSMAVETVAPSPTALVFPAGWSTATPTTTAVPSSTRPVRASIQAEALASPTITVTATPKASSLPTRRPTTVPRSTEGQSAPTPALKPPDRLVIPAIKLDSPVVPIGWHILEEDGQFSRIWEVADYVVGWHKTSAYPGSMGNVVLNGHHNIRGEVFRYLVDVQVGDRALVYVGDQVYHYAVTEKHILKERGEPPEVRRQNASWMGPTADERLTMITCWPYTNNTHRLVVVAKPALPLQLDGLER